MTESLKTEGKFTYAEAGEGKAIIVLHGLMGALSNFDKTFGYFSAKGYKVLIPELPLYTLPLLKTNVKHLAKFLHDFIAHKELASIRKLVLVRCTVGNKYTKTFTTVLVCPEVCSKRGTCSQFKLRLLSSPG